MKKILVTANVMTIIEKEKSFLDREGIKLFKAATNDDVLSIHRTERVDVIIADLRMPGMKIEELCTAIRSDAALSRVSVIILCPDNAADIEKCTQCKANAVLTLPMDPAQLLEKVRQLMDISWRESYRVLVSVSVSGTSKDRSFFCRSGNISSTGMLIETEKVLEKGEQLACAFFLPDSAQIKTKGEIVRVIKQAAGSKTCQYGIRFSQLPAEAKSAIEVFVERKSQVSTSKR
jgi:CheY-like chemotaxis protein/Tfp pilus assembly protein PilZ